MRIVYRLSQITQERAVQAREGRARGPHVKRKKMLSVILIFSITHDAQKLLNVQAQTQFCQIGFNSIINTFIPHNSKITIFDNSTQLLKSCADSVQCDIIFINGTQRMQNEIQEHLRQIKCLLRLKSSVIINNIEDNMMTKAKYRLAQNFGNFAIWYPIWSQKYIRFAKDLNS